VDSGNGLAGDRPNDAAWMRRALELGRLGEGHVEPNPMVGCVIVADGRRIAEGFHTRFGAPHAEAEALSVAGSSAAGATLFVTLEPCCHHGKTPPCTDAIINAGISRVVIGRPDPFHSVDGQGIAQLRHAGIEVQVGCLTDQATQLIAPFQMLWANRRPWVIGKWAMSLDGKMSSRTGHSRWISGTESRRVVHQIRRRVDAILVGRATAVIDDPRLTARPPGPRQALRVVADSKARIDLASRLVRSAGEFPLMIAVGPDASEDRCRRLVEAGCDLLRCSATNSTDRLSQLLAELGRRHVTNVLCEGGGHLLASLFDARLLDEVHVFIAPTLVGGADASVPLAGYGLPTVPAIRSLANPIISLLGHDVYIRGRLRKGAGFDEPTVKR